MADAEDHSFASDHASDEHLGTVTPFFSTIPPFISLFLSFGPNWVCVMWTSNWTTVILY